jgi:hypothetical protein
LRALAFSMANAPADMASVSQAILDDKNVAHPPLLDAFSFNGLLYIPNRGVLKVLPGDVVAVDPNSGWPVLLAPYAFSASGALWRHS